MVAIPKVDLDELPLGFGKHKGLTPLEVLEEDPNYIVWMYENVRPVRCSKELYEEALEDYDDLYPARYGVSNYDYPMDESPFGELDWNDNWRS